MKRLCGKCGKEIPNWIKIDGEIKNVSKRKFCIECSPYKKHNTCRYIAKDGYKFCTKCKKELSIHLFSKKTKNRINSWCKKCLYLLQSQKDHKRKEEAVQYKGGECIQCGYDKYYGALEFHHRNPLEKDISFRYSRKRTWETYKLELDKCDLLCSNCHAEKHHEIDMERQKFTN